MAITTKACPAGDLDACEQVASELGFEDPKTNALNKKLCDAGRPNACMSLARTLPDGKPRDALEEKARTARKRTCEVEKIAADCLSLGLDLDNASLQPRFRKPEAALPFFRAGCELGNHTACLYAAASGALRGKPQEALDLQRRYVEMMEGLCELPMPVACANLASEYRSNGRLPADAEKAKVLARKACEGGLATSCTP